MPFYVYILWSASLRKTYVGFTANLDARLHAHNNGIKGWTLRGRPWILINSETFNEKGDAIAREKYLKSGVGREFIKKEILFKIP